MDLDVATEAMVGDPSRFKLVMGKTAPEVNKRFGFLSELSQVPEYYQHCYENSPWVGRQVMFIRKSNWMVIFTEGKATNLVLAKGC